MSENIIVGLDIGSSAIRLVVGQLDARQKEEKLRIIGAVEAPSSGINKGIVTGIEDVTSAISNCLDKAERLTGVPITNVCLSINTPHIKCEKSKGVVAIGKSNGEITEDDIERVIEASRAFSLPANYQVLHVIPIRFCVDGQQDIKDPLGMVGVRLEVETLIIWGFSTEINNLTKAVYRTGLNIDDLVLSPLACAESTLEARQKELGSVLINIGSSTTSLVVFEERDILHASVLPIGAEDITKDLAICLRCPIDLAEKIKNEYGSAISNGLTKKDEIDLTGLEEEYGEQVKAITPLSTKHVAEIIEARIEDIFERVDKDLKKIGRSGMLPAGAFLVGGGSKIEGVSEVAKKILRLPVTVGSSKTIESVIGKVNDPRFLTALGLVIWGNEFSSGKKGTNFSKIGFNVKDYFSKAQEWFKSLMP